MSIHYEALLIDLDGTLVDSIGFLKKTVGQLCANYGVIVSDAEFEVYNGSPTLVFLDKLRARWPQLPDLKTFAAEYQDRIQEQYALLPAYSWATDHLKKLASQHPLALVTSNKSEWVYAWLQQQQFEQYFTTIVHGETVKNGKPHPEPYITAMQQLGVLGQPVGVIEDAWLGVISGLSAGCDVIWFKGPPAFQHQSLHVVSTESQLIEKICHATPQPA